MKSLTLTREQRVTLLVGGLAVLIVWVYVVYVVGPLKSQASELGRQVQVARQRLKVLEGAVANEVSLRKQYEQWDEKVKSVRNLLPAQEELADVIQLLSGFAAKTQVKVETIFPTSPAEGDEEGSGPKGNKAKTGLVVYKDVLIQVEGSAGYHQLGSFLSLVESSEKPMRLSSLRIAANPQDPIRHHLKMLVRAYFASSGLSPATDTPKARASGRTSS